MTPASGTQCVLQLENEHGGGFVIHLRPPAGMPTPDYLEAVACVCIELRDRLRQAPLTARDMAEMGAITLDVRAAQQAPWN